MGESENVNTEMQQHSTPEIGVEKPELNSFDDLEEEDVRVVKHPDYINISVKSELGIQFRAWTDEDRLVHFVICTTREDGTRHEYFERHRASDIAKRVLASFGETEPVQGIAFDWGRPNSQGGLNDNYTTYIEARNNAVKSGMSPEEAKLAAVRSTWTYNRIGKPNGFSRLETPDDIIELDDVANPRGIRGVLRKEL